MTTLKRIAACAVLAALLAADAPQTAPTTPEAQPMTADQALQILEQWRAVAILPQSSLRDHLLIQEALRVLKAFVSEHTAAPAATPAPKQNAAERN